MTSDKGPLTLERMREDVARMIDEPAETIGDDDNLLDLGLDSMRMLNLSMAWSDTGVALEFADLAESLTLREWWQTVQRKQGQDTV
ncbi:phosphopantetheine-binding protein [Halomonas sp. WWR20]